ncbi:hypothetical protein [Streptomyces sp. 147326]|uniref:hypothetical protein n=1 Tax=Streptomyces sp. 147326 TaxID=3074379 RepID=UPI00385743ED
MSHGALFTGRYPLHNGLHDVMRGTLRAPSVFTHARRYGRRTVLMTDSPVVLNPGQGFTREVDTYLIGQDDAFVDAVVGADSTLAWAYLGPVEPAGAVAGAGGDEGRSTYPVAVEQFMALRFAPFVERLTDRVAALGRRLLLVVVAGHGRRWTGPQDAVTGAPGEGVLTEAVLRVPLIIAGDGVVPGRHCRRIRTVDVAPTVLELAGLPVSVTGLFDGQSRASVVLGRQDLGDDAPALAGSYEQDRVGEVGYLDDLRVVRWSSRGVPEPESVRTERLDGGGVPRPDPGADAADVLTMLDDHRGALAAPGQVTVTEEMRVQLRSQGYSV